MQGSFCDALDSRTTPAPETTTSFTTPTESTTTSFTTTSFTTTEDPALTEASIIIGGVNICEGPETQW